MSGNMRAVLISILLTSCASNSHYFKVTTTKTCSIGYVYNSKDSLCYFINPPVQSYNSLATELRQDSVNSVQSSVNRSKRLKSPIITVKQCVATLAVCGVVR
jgi:hypothetical protein